MRRRRALAAVAPALLLLSSCGRGDDTVGGTTASVAVPEPIDGALTVLAAASLTGAFAEIEAAFEADHPGVDVVLSFDGSSTLAAAIIEGAPADVFASADQASSDKVAGAGAAAGEPVVFATNALQIVVPKGNPAGISSLRDLVSADVTLVLCGAEVPCGQYAAQAFEQAGLAVPPAGDQDNVKGVLTQVQLGEADAGIVYVTDVLAAADVEGIDLPADEQVEATYPASVLNDASNPDGAAAFLAFLTDDEAQAILEAFGFGLP